MKSIILLVSASVLMALVAVGCGGGGGSNSSVTTTGGTAASNPSPKHGFYTIGSLLAAGPSGVAVNIYSDDAYLTSSGKATLTACGRADNVIIRVMTQAGVNNSDCLLYASSGNVNFSTVDAYETPGADLMMQSGGGTGTGSEKIAKLEKIDTAVFSRSLTAGVNYQPGNRLKLGVWTIVGGNADTKIIPLISSYQG